VSDLIMLDELDADGAIRDAADAAGDTRMDFFKKAAVGGGSLIAGGALMGGLPALAMGAKPSKKNDVKILQFALTLEYLEAAFYKEAVAGGALTGDVLAAAKIVAKHEATHVKTLKQVLGSASIKSPKFDFKGTTADQAKFVATAQALEDTGVRAYSGQAPNIKQAAVLKAATSILTVEARHASRFRTLNGNNFAPAAFDKPASMKRILSDVKKTGFIKS
jgi:rubrerythrin